MDKKRFNELSSQFLSFNDKKKLAIIKMMFNDGFDSAFEVNSQEEVFKQFLDFVKDAKAEELFEACVENPVPDF